jgi:hypothetical protein
MNVAILGKTRSAASAFASSIRYLLMEHLQWEAPPWSEDGRGQKRSSPYGASTQRDMWRALQIEKGALEFVFWDQ